MKKNWILVAFFCIIMLSLVACGTTTDTSAPAGDNAAAEEDTAAEPEATPAADRNIRLSLCTASSGGSYYPIGCAIAEIINQNVAGVQCTAETSGGAAENITLIGSGQSDIGFGTAHLVKAALEGASPYDQVYDNLTVLCTGYKAAPLQIVVPANSSIQTVTDLKGKKVSLGPTGGASLVTINDLFNFFGFSIEDTLFSNLSYADSATALSDSQIDAFIVGAADPTSAITSLVAEGFDIRMIPLAQEDADAFLAEYPCYIEYNLTTDIYGLDSDYLCIAMPNLLVIDAGIAEDVVYDILTAIYDNTDVLYASHASASTMTLEDAAEDLGLPFHPGAVTYFTEKGLM